MHSEFKTNLDFLKTSIRLPPDLKKDKKKVWIIFEKNAQKFKNLFRFSFGLPHPKNSCLQKELNQSLFDAHIEDDCERPILFLLWNQQSEANRIN